MMMIHRTVAGPHATVRAQAQAHTPAAVKTMKRAVRVVANLRW